MKSKKIYIIQIGGWWKQKDSRGTGHPQEGSILLEILSFLISRGGRSTGVHTVILKLSIDIAHMFKCAIHVKYKDTSTKQPNQESSTYERS